MINKNAIVEKGETAKFLRVLSVFQADTSTVASTHIGHLKMTCTYISSESK